MSKVLECQDAVVKRLAVAVGVLAAGCSQTGAPPRADDPVAAHAGPATDDAGPALSPPTTEPAPATTTTGAPTEPATTLQLPPATSTTVVAPTPTGDIPSQIRAAFGPAGEKAVRVARCESTLRPAATNGSHYGLFQIHIPSHEARITRLGYTPADMLTAGPNIAVAVNLYNEQGWGPWTCAA